MGVYLISDLKKIRRNKGLSRKMLSIRINNLSKKESNLKVMTVAVKTIQRAEEGKPIKEEKAKYIAKGLDLELEEIIDKEKMREKNKLSMLCFENIEELKSMEI